MKQSNFFSLNWRDFLRGWIMAIGTPALYLLQEMIPGFDIHSMYKIAISASVTYLLKNFFTKPDTKLYSEEIGGGGIQNPPKT
jgi:hypothetical protein